MRAPWRFPSFGAKEPIKSEGRKLVATTAAVDEAKRTKSALQSQVPTAKPWWLVAADTSQSTMVELGGFAMRKPILRPICWVWKAMHVGKRVIWIRVPR